MGCEVEVPLPSHNFEAHYKVVMSNVNYINPQNTLSHGACRPQILTSYVTDNGYTHYSHLSTYRQFINHVELTNSRSDIAK